MPLPILITLIVLTVYSVYSWYQNSSSNRSKFLLVPAILWVLAGWLYISFNVLQLSGQAGAINRWIVVILAVALGVFVWWRDPGNKDHQ